MLGPNQAALVVSQQHWLVLAASTTGTIVGRQITVRVEMDAQMQCIVRAGSAQLPMSCMCECECIMDLSRGGPDQLPIDHWHAWVRLISLPPLLSSPVAYI